MEKDLANKIVLITGCSSGFGLATAIEMAKSGFRVFASVQNFSLRPDLDKQAHDANVKLEVIELDVTQEESINKAVDHIETTAGPIDILVNNAGYGLGGFAEEVSLTELRKQFDTNFFGMVATTKAVIPKMRERKSGHIINITSLAGLIGFPGAGAYAASKFAAEGYMETLRFEGLLDGYYVSNIEPGFFKTKVAENHIEAQQNLPYSPHHLVSEALKKDIKHQVKNGGDPKQIAKLIVTIAKQEKPSFRHVIGKESILFTLKRFLPQAIFEKFLMKQLRKVIKRFE